MKAKSAQRESAYGNYCDTTERAARICKRVTRWYSFRANKLHYIQAARFRMPELRGHHFYYEELV
jgi:hypothetical protein